MTATDVTARDLRIPVGSGEDLPGYAALPAAAEGRPAVLVLGEIWGVNANIRATCTRLARAGIIALAPDLYRGEAPPRESDPMPHVMSYFARFDDPRGIRDCRASLSHALSGLGVRSGPVFAWGFCKGGRFAHYLAAFDLRLAGAINFYGRLDFPRQGALKPFTPLDVADLVAAPYLGLFAGHDPLITRDSIEALRARFTARRHPHHLHVYAQAEHAFFNDTRPAYHAAVAAEAWTKATGFITSGRLP